jgi:amino acid adenylation domain-containing protein
MSQADSPEAVAIIGLAGRFPQARNVAEFWQNLRAGREAVSFFTDEQVRWLPIEHPPRLDDPSFVKARAILERPEWFDAAFFGMNPREAAFTDPQHRVFLECAWEALEHAGCNPETYAGPIGVFAGASMNSYLFTNVLTNRGLAENQGFFPTLIANDNDFLTTRVSYKFNLRGPSLNVQTACSTSLVAVVMAVQNLLSYRCDVALAGGASITFPAHRGQQHVAGGILSADGHCRAFDAQATGTVLGDGVGVVVLKRLSDALADGDNICAVIRGTALNNDGSVKIGFTAPSSAGQAEAIALAHAEAGFAPETVSYIEAHGTGTPLGDPIEVEGLKQAFGLAGERGQFCGIGSVKTNIGHLDITAGVAGLIKTVLALQAKELPPSLHFGAPNPKIDFKRSPFYVVDSLRPWPQGATPRRAGVSSFGIGGTNAHVALEEAPPAVASGPARLNHVLTLSARTPTALAAAAANLATHLEENPGANLADVAWTLQAGRKVFAHRRAIAAGNVADAVRGLREPSAAAGKALEKDTPVAFLFPGQGAQHPGMAAGLYAQETIFRQVVDECCDRLRPMLGLDLRTLLFPSPEKRDEATARLNETAITQPALFVIEYALARLWLSWGIKPAALLGHSLGEYVAATVAGVFSLADGLRLVAARARLMQAQPRGVMLAVRLPEAEAAALATGAVALAGVNAPDLSVLAGPADAIDALELQLAARGVVAKRLATSHAFHSAMMDAVLAPFAAEFRGLKLNPPAIPIVSNVTGDWLGAEQATDPAYWTRHLRQTVRFADGVATLQRDLQPALLEVGPGLTLATLARQHPATVGRPVPVGSLGRPGTDDLAALTETLARLWTAGVPIDWPAWHGPARRLRVPLPTYPFERQRHWIEAGQTLGFGATTRGTSGPASSQSIPVEAGALLPRDVTPVSEPATRGTSGSTARSIPAREQLAALFRELSGHDFRGENAARTFQELGLDSLLLTQASFVLQERCGVNVTMRQLIEQHSTLEKLAAHVAGSRAPAPAVAPESGAEGQASAVTQPTGAPATTPAAKASVALPLTPAQQEIWVAAQRDAALSASFNESCTIALAGALDLAALRAALSDLVARHETLRLTFAADGQQQVIAAHAEADLPVVDLAGIPESERDHALRDEAFRIANEPFDLAAAPPWRMRLLRTAADRHLLVGVWHHIICDGWSQPVLLFDLAELYNARRAGRPAALPPADRFSDYVQRDAAHRAAPEFAASEAHWLECFAGGAPTLELPADRARPPTRTYAGSHHRRVLSAATAEAVRRLAAAHDATVFTALLAGFTTLLHRISGQDDLVVGVPAAPQVLGGHPRLAGQCVNLLPIRSQVGDGQDVAGFIRETRRRTLDAFEHWQHPFANLLRKLDVPREANRVPLTTVTFNVGRQRGTLRFDGLEATAGINPKGFINFDLNVHVGETADGFVLDCYYSTELYDSDTIARTFDRYELLLAAAAATPARPVHRLPLLTERERQLVLGEWNRTDRDYPRDLCLHELFEEQAQRTPEAIAVRWDDQSWTYGQLDARANQVAHRLRRLGVKPETPVGVHAARTPATLAALLGILKAGGAYIPLDPAYPAERVAFMLEDSRAAVLITDRERAGPPPPTPGARQFDLGADAATLDREPVGKPECYPLPGNLAYVIYTSGSTGRPKGVAIEHRSAVQLAHWARDEFAPAETAGMLAGTSLCFDLSVFEIFATLAWGGSVILADSPLHLASLPARDRVTFLNTVPSVAAELLRLDAIPTSVTTILLAGEPFPDHLAERLLALPHVRKVYDGYGPSEDTTYSTWSQRLPGVRGNIGRPLPNTRIYLLDRHLELVPPGVPGEICIAGEGLARGYLNQPVLTQQKFIRNPLSDAPAARLYRTGDLGRQRPDSGLLEYLGRADHQVKIRGFRIELGEIESVLARQAGIARAHVLVHEAAPGDKRLVAYYSATPAGAPAADELRRALARLLPEYMVPAAFVAVERFTLTPNGKLDRRALPAPDFSSAPAATGPVAPRTITEEILAGIWCEVLHLPAVGVHDNFFALGGHSLLVTQALARVKQAFSIDLPLRHAFEAPTIAALAAHIDAALLEEIKSSSGTDTLPSHDVAIAAT